MPDTGRFPILHKGRGAVSNPGVRFESTVREAFDDGWATLTEDMPPLRTTLTREAAKSVLTTMTART